MNVEQTEDGDKKPDLSKYKHWQKELIAANKRLSNFKKQGDQINKIYLGRHGGNNQDPAKKLMRLNLFHSDTETLYSTMYGNLPRVDVSRRYNDANDDTARVCAEMIERLINLDTVNHAQDIDTVLRCLLLDRLTTGLGVARVRYAEEETGDEAKPIQSAPIEYVHWGDILWSWARNWGEVTWVGFKNYLSHEEAAKRYGEDVAKQLEYKNQTPEAEDMRSTSDSDDQANWQAAEVYEIWCKKTRTVYEVCLGYEKVLKSTPDPLQLANFFPVPPFFAANVTTALYMPLSDYKLAEDLYNEIDLLSARITKITEAVRVVGTYDAAQKEVQNMLNVGVDNKLIPVESWAMYLEKGGAKGCIDWYPVKEVVETLQILREMRHEAIGLLRQTTGMSDIMRGDLSNQYEGVGQTQEKTKYGSSRIQALQEEFAKFVSQLMQLKAEVIGNFFTETNIVNLSNMQRTFDGEDRDVLMAAVALLKNPKQSNPRIEVRPESMAMVDYAKQQEERTDVLNAIGAFLNSAAPLMQESPQSQPTVLQLLQWAVSGFKGASEIEGVLDKAVEDAIAAQKEAENAPDEPDPELIKIQASQQLEQFKHQSAVQQKQLDMQADSMQSAQEHEQKMAEINAQAMAKQGEIQAKFQADLVIEQIQAQNNIAQTQATGEVEVLKDEAATALEIEKEAAKTELELGKIARDTEAKISQEVVKGQIQRVNTAQQQQASEADNAESETD